MNKFILSFLIIFSFVSSNIAFAVPSEDEYSTEYETIATTKTLKIGPGVLHTIKLGGGLVSGKIIVYDNIEASGEIIANFNYTHPVQEYTYDVKFSKGLTFVTSSDTNVFVSYK